MSQPSSSLVSSPDRIVAHYQLNLKWMAYSRDRLTPQGAGAKVLVQRGIFTRHSRRCWAYVVGNCPTLKYGVYEPRVENIPATVSQYGTA